MKKRHNSLLIVSGALLLISATAAIAQGKSPVTVKVAVGSAAPKHGIAIPLKVSVANSGAAIANSVVDLEVYDNATKKRVAQQFWQNQTLPKSKTTQFKWAWTPATKGSYTIKLGVFANGWSKLTAWDDSALAVKVS